MPRAGWGAGTRELLLGDEMGWDNLVFFPLLAPLGFLVLEGASLGKVF